MGPDNYVAKKRGKFFKSRKHQFQIITEGAMVGKRKANQMMEKMAKGGEEGVFEESAENVRSLQSSPSQCGL